jgi:hypothetical protein
MTKHNLMICLSVIVVMMLAAAPVAAQSRPLIQMAILLDTSGSMEGLIEQAKAQLWKVVNELATARRNGQAPQLQVALYEYGKDSIPASEGYLRMIVPLSGDLDRLSAELFQLKTNGGSEHCGQVIQRAARDLAWSSGANDLKMIFIAGNEPFTQGAVDYRQAVKGSISRGIVVNTIFCGNFEEGVQGNWKDGADLADGRYLTIDQNHQLPRIAAPQDQELDKLNQDLNKTYLAYGDKGLERKALQEKQDANALTLSPTVSAQRVAAKSSGQYRNAEWDLVDAKKEGKVKVAEMKDEELPEELRILPAAEREAYIEQLQKKRKTVQDKIQKLSRERETYVNEQMKKLTVGSTLDNAILGAVRAQATAKQFRFEK